MKQFYFSYKDKNWTFITFLMLLMYSLGAQAALWATHMPSAPFPIEKPEEYKAALGPGSIEKNKRLLGLPRENDFHILPSTECENDSIPPTALAKNISIKLLLPSGINLTAAEVNNGSGDNCKFSLSLSQSFFDCSDIGTQTLTLTAIDEAGNIDTDEFTVNIEGPDPFVAPSGGSSLVAIPSEYTTIDEDLTINMTGTIDGALISIDENFEIGDELDLAVAYNLPSGVRSRYNSSTGIFSLSGQMSAAELQEIFRNVQFRTSNDSPLTRKITFTIGTGVSNPENNHYYEYVSGLFTWHQAKANAESLTLYGLRGYLATSTSESENRFIRTKLSDDGWLGGSDNFSVINTTLGSNLYQNQAAAEGNWYWVTGPEAGTQFSINSSSFSGEYANWNGNEPNNVAGSEHNLQIYFVNNGRWNDESDHKELGYIVEYGGFLDDQSCFSFSGTKSVLVNQAPKISEISTIVGCPSSEVNFSVNISDDKDNLDKLDLKITSSNPSLLPESNIHLISEASGYSIRLDPVGRIQETTLLVLTVTDSQNAKSEETFSYTTIDNEAPVVRTQDIVLDLNGNGTSSITPEDIDNGTSDNCGIASMELDISDFTCRDAGENIVSLIVTDHDGNIGQGTAIVTIRDAEPPVPNIEVLEDIISECSITEIPVPTASDDCIGTITATTEDPTSYTEEGDYVIVWEYDDGNGNIVAQEQFVFIHDITPPAVYTKDIIINLASNPIIQITPEDVDAGSKDNCEIIDLSLDRDTFDDIGQYEVILTATDAAGNSSESAAKVIVERRKPNNNKVHVIPSLLEFTSIATVIVPEDSGIAKVQVLETATNHYKFFEGNESSKMEIDVAPLKGTLLVRIIDKNGTVYLRKLIAL